MKKVNPFAELDRRVTTLEERPDTASAIIHKKASTDYRDSFGAVARQTVTIRLGPVTAKTPAVTLYTHQWSAAYPAGGELISGLEALVPGFIAAIPSSGAGYTVTWDATNNKLVAYTAPGTEVLPLVDLSVQIGTTPILVYGTPPSLFEAYQAKGDEVIQSIHVYFSESTAKSGTNFWTIEARLKTDHETYGRRLGSSFSNVDRSFTAYHREALYNPQRGAGKRLAEGESVVLSATAATQSCPPLGEATVVLDIQRKVI